MIDPRHFRDVLGHFATGVTVITSFLNGDMNGMAANSFVSVSIDPPLIGFAVQKTSTTYPRIREAGSFCVNMLASHQEEVARIFAMRDVDRFEKVTWRPANYSKAAILDGGLAWIDCKLGQEVDAGDHFFVFGEVQDLDISATALPLIFFRGRYGLDTEHG